MNVLFIYIVKFSICLAAIFLFYHLALRKLTFYVWNRFYFLIYTLLCFLIPLIDISPIVSQNHFLQKAKITEWPSFNLHKPWAASQEWTMHQLFLVIIITGMTFMTVRFIFQFLSFRRLVKKAKPITTTGIKLFQIDEHIMPFSFGNAVFLNQSLHSQHELKDIIRHEMIHVKQKHSLDIIWIEILCILNWFNPFIWLIRKAVRQNLEYIADRQVLQNGINRKEYQYLLLKVIGNVHFSIASKFNFSSLKKRIAMMNKIKSAKINLLRFTFLVPLLAIVLLSFRNKIRQLNQRAIEIQPQHVATLTDTVPAPKKVVPHLNIVGKIMVHKNLVTVYLRSGMIEKYNLDKQEEKQTFEKKYGEVPPPPPPGPPPPIKPPVLKADGVKDMVVKQKVVKVYLRNGMIEQYDLKDAEQKKLFEKKYGEIPPPPPPASPAPPAPPMPPAPPLPKTIKDKNVKSVEITNEQAKVYLRSGKTEVYNLKNKKEKEAFEKKYGKVQEPPPPPKPPKVDMTQHKPPVIKKNQ